MLIKQLSCSSTAEKWGLRTRNWGLISKIEPLMIIWADCSENLKIENWISSCQCRSLHSFQRFHFICHLFGCKFFGCNQLRIMPDIVSKLLRVAIWRSCAFLLESEQTPFSRIGNWFRSPESCSAASHMFQFGTCRFIPMPYIYTQTKEWSKDWAKRWALLWSVTRSPC